MNLKKGAGNKWQPYDSHGRYCSTFNFQKSMEEENQRRKLKEKEERLKNEQREKQIQSMLTPAQLKAVKRADNTIRDHCNKKDYEALKNEFYKDKKYYNKRGKIWDHQDECKHSLEAFEKSLESLSGSLKNPNLQPCVKMYLEQKLSICKKIYMRFKKLYKGEK